MGSVSMIDGHVDEPENGVYCKDCKHSIFYDCCGECLKGYMGIIYPCDYCGKGELKN